MTNRSGTSLLSWRPAAALGPRAAEPRLDRPIIAALAPAPRDLAPTAEPAIAVLPQPPIISAAATHCGLVRRINEDAVLDASSVGLWAVADGVGGADAGDRASMAIVETLALVPRPRQSSDLLASSRAALEDVNRRLIAESRRVASTRGIASTVVCLLICEGRFFCMWAGDSRLYRLRNRQFEQVSRDHSHAQELVESGAITAAEAERHPAAHMITNAIGIEPMLRLDCVEGEVTPGDRFLLCSDGLTRVVSDPEIALVVGLVNPAEAVDYLIQMALDRGAPDNVSVVAIAVADADPAHG